MPGSRKEGGATPSPQGTVKGEQTPSSQPRSQEQSLLCDGSRGEPDQAIVKEILPCIWVWNWDEIHLSNHLAHLLPFWDGRHDINSREYLDEFFFSSWCRCLKYRPHWKVLFPSFCLDSSFRRLRFLPFTFQAISLIVSSYRIVSEDFFSKGWVATWAAQVRRGETYFGYSGRCCQTSIPWVWCRLLWLLLMNALSRSGRFVNLELLWWQVYLA